MKLRGVTPAALMTQARETERYANKIYYDQLTDDSAFLGGALMSLAADVSYTFRQPDYPP
jgi:hypothetical protein